MTKGVIFESKDADDRQSSASKPKHEVSGELIHHQVAKHPVANEAPTGQWPDRAHRSLESLESEPRSREAGSAEGRSGLSVKEDKTKKQTHPILSTEIFVMLRKYIQDSEALKKESTPIHVDEIASKVAKLYETIRKVVDWQEDNVLRRSAIERILKRLLFVKVSGLSINQKIDTDDLAETVTIELIRGGHLPNDEVPREAIPVVSEALAKYIFFLEQTSLSSGPVADIKKKMNLTTFLMEIAACEIEEILANPIKEYALLEAMTNTMMSQIKIVPQDSMSAEEKREQIYIASCRTLFDLDDSFIIYRLLDLRHSDWRNPQQEVLPERFKETVSFWENSEKVLEHPQSKDFNRICEEVDTVFTLLGDFLEQKKEKPKDIVITIESKKKFERAAGKLYDKRYQTLKRRLFRLGVFSTLSVFLSNWFTFFIIEIPLAKLFYEGFSLFTAFIDFLIPTAVMFVLVMIIRPPSKTNRERVLNLLKGFVYKSNKKKFYQIRTNKKIRPIFKVILGSLYMFMTWFVFTVIGATFYLAGLPMTSVVFDTFTIALTVFAAVMIRNKSKELVVGDKTSIFEFILDMVSVPVARVGSFFAKKWKEYNIVAIFFNFVIETPFALILKAIEEWSQFLKDRKAELR